MEKSIKPQGRLKPGFLLLSFLFPLLLQSQSVHAWPWQWNRYDKKELRNGKWRVFHDYEQKVVHYQGRYKHGKERGTWRTYTADGKLYFKERIRPMKKDIKTVYYHPNGKVSHKGLAYLRAAESGGVQYYWDGDWEYYDQEGQLLGTKTFVKGNPTSNIPVPDSTKKSK